MTLHVAPFEQGLIRVFAVNQPADQVAQAITAHSKQAVARDLLGTPLTQDGSELFAVSDLAGVGLSGYLAEGYSVPEAQLTAERFKLDALDGYVLLVFSAAFEGYETSLTPTADVTHIGTFGEFQPDNTPLPLEAEAAEPYTGPPPLSSRTQPKRQRYGSVVVAILMLLAALVLWWAVS